MKKIAYIRVSTAEQRHDRQVEGLEKLGCDELHIETLSACSAKRPVYDHVCKKLQAGDTLVVFDFDRAYRSSFDALAELRKLTARGVNFQVTKIAMDTATPEGLFVFTMLSALAEFERKLLSQRTKEGIAAARKRGKRIGRPPKLNDDQLRYARARLATDGATTSSVAQELGVPRWTLSRSLRRQDALSVSLEV